MILAGLTIPSIAESSSPAVGGSVCVDLPLSASVGLDLLVPVTGEIDNGDDLIGVLPTVKGALVLGAAAGDGGGELHAGYAFFSLDEGGFALGATATVLRTWGDPINADSDETYAGPGLFLHGPVKVGFGVLFRVDGSEGRVMPRLTIGLGHLTGF